MTWERSVYSKMVSTVGYDSDNQELIIEWANGKSTAYAGVPEDVADECSRAPSVGQYVNTEIKGRYSYRNL